MKQYAGMTVKHVEMIKEKLELVVDDDYLLDKDAFQLAFRSKQAETERIFKLFDLSNEGKIDMFEFICALGVISQATLF